MVFIISLDGPANWFRSRSTKVSQNSKSIQIIWYNRDLFSPNDGTTNAIVIEIDNAKPEFLVQVVPFDITRLFH